MTYVLEGSGFSLAGLLPKLGKDRRSDIFERLPVDPADSEDRSCEWSGGGCLLLLLLLLVVVVVVVGLLAASRRYRSLCEMYPFPSWSSR